MQVFIARKSYSFASLEASYSLKALKEGLQLVLLVEKNSFLRKLFGITGMQSSDKRKQTTLNTIE